MWKSYGSLLIKNLKKWINIYFNALGERKIKLLTYPHCLYNVYKLSTKKENIN